MIGHLRRLLFASYARADPIFLEGPVRKALTTSITVDSDPPMTETCTLRRTTTYPPST